MSASQRDEQDQSQDRASRGQSRVETDPLLPRPITSGVSIVEGIPSPLESSLSQLGEGDGLEIYDLVIDDEEETQVWSRREAITTPFWRHQPDQTVDMESTDEWIAPRVSPRSSSESASFEDQEKREGRSLPKFQLSSMVDRQLYQLTVVTPTLGGRSGVISPLVSLGFIIFASVISKSSEGVNESTLWSLWSVVLFMLFLFCVLLSIWASRRQLLSVNQAQVSYSLKILGRSVASRSFPLSELQEVTLSAGAEHSAESKEEIILIGKDLDLSFASHLPSEEKRYLFEIVKEKVVDLQQGVFR